MSVENRAGNPERVVGSSNMALIHMYANMPDEQINAMRSSYGEYAKSNNPYLVEKANRNLPYIEREKQNRAQRRLTGQHEDA